jgi:serine/threonine-protein kinase
MNQDSHWRQVKSYYTAALDLPPAEREAWLARHCEDPAVRREVLELLAADREATDWLPTAADVAAEAPELPPDLEGQTVGRFEVLQRIDSGGMGAVYLARIVDDGREVALKVIQRGLVTEQALARFLREREILARLDHPGICPMLDSGTTPDGRPFLVMPFLEGAESITDHCERREASLTERVALFESVCHAVQHAHQNLVVHSDLKPGNVLVTPDGRVQLVDFGISRLLAPGHEDLTRRFAERRPATLDFASPEQLRGDSPSTLSDVYSLGALLYHLLSGDKAYRVPTGSESADESARPEPHRPVNLPLDLYNICCKAMAAEPARRYGSSSALAEDLERWRSDLPVRARAPSLGYRMGKFVRRHAWPVATAGVAALAVVALAVVLAVNNARINKQAERIVLERDRAEATAEFWAHLFEQTDPVASADAVPSVDELLGRALAELTGESNLPGATRARLLGVISTTYWNLADQPAAREAAEAAVDAAMQPDVDAATRALANKQLANIAMALDDREAARQSADRAIAAMGETEDLGIAERAQILDAHALVLEMEGDIEAAAEVMEEVVALQAQLPIDEIIVDHATAWGNLAFMYYSLARNSEDSQPWFDRAADGVARSLELLEAHFGPDHPRVGFMLNASGAINLESGRLEPALADFEAAARIAEATLPPGHEMLVSLHYNQGTLNRLLGRHAAAAAAFERSYEGSQGFDDAHPHRVSSLIGMIRAHIAAGREAAARARLAQLDALAERLPPAHSGSIWVEVFDCVLRGQAVPPELRERARGSDDEELLAYLEATGDDAG